MSHIQGIDRDEITRLTEEYGGAWGINHTRRLLQLVSLIGEKQKYDAEIVWIAAHLHDWGGYAPWVKADVDHAVRSTQVAKDFLIERNCPEESATHILECIARHHSCSPDCSIEAILLSDADALDFLGVVGILRDFAKKPKDMRNAFQTVKTRKEKLVKTILLPRTREIAVERIREMEPILSSFDRETFGCF